MKHPIFLFSGSRRRREQGPEFLVDVAQGGIMHEQALVDFGQAFEDGGVGRLLLATF